jgi:phage terminase large subunit
LLPSYDRYIKRTEATWDEDWKRRYLNGIWGRFEGQIYKEFNPTKHVGEFYDLPVAYHILGVDWGLNTPHCLLVMGVTKNNKLVVKKEIYGKRVTTEQLSKKIASLHKDYAFKTVYIDPSAADLILQCQDRGVPTIGGYNDVPNGISKMKSIFAGKHIYIDKSCYNLIMQLQAYRYKKGTEMPLKEDDHAPDALRYGVTNYSPYSDDTGFGWGFWKKGR